MINFCRNTNKIRAAGSTATEVLEFPALGGNRLEGIVNLVDGVVYLLVVGAAVIVAGPGDNLLGVALWDIEILVVKAFEGKLFVSIEVLKLQNFLNKRNY